MSADHLGDVRYALAATGLTNADGEALTFSPHDFRRIFVIDAIMNGRGLPAVPPTQAHGSPIRRPVWITPSRDVISPLRVMCEGVPLGHSTRRSKRFVVRVPLTEEVLPAPGA